MASSLGLVVAAAGHIPTESDDRLLSQCSHVSQRRTLDTVLVLTPQVDRPVVIGGAATVLWEFCATPTPQSQLFDHLAAIFGRSVTDLRHDLVPVLDELKIVRALCVG